MTQACYDLHIHTIASGDSSISVKELLTRALELGLAGLAVTDHDQLTKVASPYKELLLIPGEEVSTLEGHILALGIYETVPPWLTPEETVELIHEQGAVAVPSHPFPRTDGYPGLLDKVYELNIDGLEVTNPKDFVDNKQARAAAKAMDVARLGGSDAHRLEAVGAGVTLLREPVETVDDFLREVRKKRTEGLLRSPSFR